MRGEQAVSVSRRFGGGDGDGDGVGGGGSFSHRHDSYEYTSGGECWVKASARRRILHRSYTRGQK